VKDEITNRTPAQRLVSELADYKAQPIASGVPVLEYLEKSKYKILPKIVKAFACCLPSSVPSERCFSDSGYLMWDRRFIFYSKLSFIEKVASIL
jgi:hypothetical protein